jgi:hypothetical protein
MSCSRARCRIARKTTIISERVLSPDRLVEAGIPFFLDPCQHLGDLLLERNDLFPDRLGFQLVRLDRLEDACRARRSAPHGQDFSPG